MIAINSPYRWRDRVCWPFGALAVVFSSACGSRTANPVTYHSPAGTVQPTAKKQEVQAAQSQLPQVSAGPQSGARVIDNLLPIGFMQLTIQGVERRCMVSAIGNGKVATAGHCFAGISLQAGSNACPDKVKIEWLSSPAAGKFVLSGFSTSCASFEISKISGDDATEFAVLRLSETGTWPSQYIRYDREATPVTSVKLAMVGPIEDETGMTFLAAGAEAFDVSDTMFLANGSYRPGFSGSPIFRIPAGQDSIDFSSPALGIYLGRGFGSGRVLRSKAFENTL